MHQDSTRSRPFLERDLDHPDFMAALRRLAAYILADLEKHPRPVPSSPADDASPSFSSAGRGASHGPGMAATPRPAPLLEVPDAAD